MPYLSIKTAAPLILAAVLYQWYLKDVLFVILGVGRTLQTIEDFPYVCRRIRHPRLEGCEDMWIDDDARLLYAACTGTVSRQNWCPTLSRLNALGRQPDGSWVSVLDIDEPGPDGLFGLRQMKITGYQGATGPGDVALDLHGFDVEVIENERLRFWLINHRPPVDGNGMMLDATKVGANSTVEVFEAERGKDELVHIRTIWDKAVFTPNKPAATGDGDFVVTNDMSSKVGLSREFEKFVGGGSLAYCSPSALPQCHIAASSGFNCPNGMVKGKDGLFYVPNAAIDKIMVMELGPDKMLRQIDVIHVGMPVDNISVDENGDIFAAGFPKALHFLETYKNPFNVDSPTTIWTIRREDGRFEVKKVLEDREARVVGGATVARHDVMSGRIFIGGKILLFDSKTGTGVNYGGIGAIAPYISVCDRVR